MRIRKFNENDEVNISSERVDEILNELKQFSAQLGENSKMMESLINELSNYKSESTKGNDQIDDSIASSQFVKSSIDDASDKVDNVINNLTDYNDAGRTYIYTENK
jgi:ABC-type transporter Mla subunit MlaD